MKKVLLVRMASAIGGAEIYNLNLIRGFKKYFPETEFYCLTNLPEFAQRIKRVDGKIFILPVFHEEVGTKRGLGRLIFHLPKYLFYFGKEIFNLRINNGIKLAILEGTTEKIVLTPLLKLLKMRVIWLEHGSVFITSRAKEVLCLYKLNSRMADKIITVSHETAKNLIKNGMAKNKVICIHTGIDTDYFKTKVQAEDKGSVVGFLGGICWEKGIDKFLLAARELEKDKSLKILKFLVVGDGPELSWAKNWVGKQHLDDIFEFAGFVEDVRPYLERFSLFYFPTKHTEGLSLAIMEAMAMGVTVVCTDVGGNRELVEHKKTGYLINNETTKQVSDFLVNLLEDSKKREHMGQEARNKIVKEFNQSGWIKKWQKIILE